MNTSLATKFRRPTSRAHRTHSKRLISALVCQRRANSASLGALLHGTPSRDTWKMCKCFHAGFAWLFCKHLCNRSTFFNLKPPRAHLHAVLMLRFMSDINQPSLPTPFYSVPVSVSDFMAISTVFHSINSPNNSPFSHSVLLVLSLCLIGPFNYISFNQFPSVLI